MVIEYLTRKINNYLTRLLLNAIKNNNGQFTAQTKDGDQVLNDIPILQNFGFASYSPKGSRGVVVNLGGNRENQIIILTEHGEYKFKDLGEGDAAIYTKDGDYIHLKSGAEIEIKTKSINITADKMEITGDITARGNITATEIKDSFGKLSTFRNDYIKHTHVSASPGSPTAPPAPPLLPEV